MGDCHRPDHAGALTPRSKVGGQSNGKKPLESFRGDPFITLQYSDPGHQGEGKLFLRDTACV